MISVIVPVYKVEKYLQKCINSIQSQTYKDLEIILIDDGSPDNCPQICDELATIDTRIKVIHKENGGLSSARNKGLEVATGNFVTFIDSDDTINQNMFENIIRVMKATNADIGMCSSQTMTDNGTVLTIDKFEEGKLYQGEDLIRDIILPLKTSSWNKIFRRSLILNHKFPEGKIHGEDLVYILRVIDQNTKLATTQYIGYNYFKRNNTITTSSFNYRSFDEVWCKDTAAEILKEKFPSFEKYATLWCFRSRLNLIRKLFPQRKTYDNVIYSYSNYLQQTYKNIKDILPIKTKIEYTIFNKYKKLYIHIFTHK